MTHGTYDDYLLDYIVFFDVLAVTPCLMPLIFLPSQIHATHAKCLYQVNLYPTQFPLVLAITTLLILFTTLFIMRITYTIQVWH
jgi:hypothetical protein